MSSSLCLPAAAVLEVFPAPASAGLATVGHRLPQIMLGGWRVDARDSRQRHRTAVARGTVDRFDDANVGQALDARGLRRDVVDDRIRKMLELRGHGVDGLERHLLALAAAHDLDGRAALRLVHPRDADRALVTEDRE